MLPSGTGWLSGISPLRLGWTSFSLVTQGAVCTPFLMPWNKTLPLLSCHRSISSLQSWSACSAPLHAALAFSVHPDNELICTLQLLAPPFDGQQHSAFSVSSWWPFLCQAVASELWVDGTPCTSWGPIRTFPQQRATEAASSLHWRRAWHWWPSPALHVARAPTAPSSKAWWKHPNLSLSA